MNRLTKKGERFAIATGFALLAGLGVWLLMLFDVISYP